MVFPDYGKGGEEIKMVPLSSETDVFSAENLQEILILHSLKVAPEVHAPTLRLLLVTPLDRIKC